MLSEFPDQFIVVACHLSSSDPFSNPDTEARGDWYGVGGIPHVRIDGKYFVVGAGDCELVTGIYRSRIQSRLTESGGVSPVDVSGVFSLHEGSGSLQATMELLDPATFAATQGTLFLYEDDITWCCDPYGEDQWDETVRLVKSQPVSLQQVGDRVTIVEEIDVHPSWNTVNLSAVAVFQETTGLKTVIQAGRLERVVDYALSIPRRVASVPDGDGEAFFHGAVENIGDATDLLDLEVGQGFGWPVDFQVDGDPSRYTVRQVSLDPGESIGFTVRVRTDQDVRVGAGTFRCTSNNTGRCQPATIRVFNGSPAILLVDDDANSDYEQPFEIALGNLGYLYDNWDVHSGHSGAAPSLGDMLGFDAIIWQTGYRTNDLITPDDADALMDYLDGGGALYVNSMDLTTAYSGPPRFLRDYLGVGSWTNTTKADIQIGVDGDPVTDGLSVGLTWPGSSSNRVDTIHASNAGTEIFRNESGDPNATRVDASAFRTVFLTALQDAIYDFSPTNSQLVMDRILGWLLQSGPSGAVDGVPGLSLGRLLAIPNPFRPRTELSFHLSPSAAAEGVRLTVVDPGGRLVRTLIDGVTEPGLHVIPWDGRDDRGHEAASGIYFARLQCLDGETGIKLVRMR